MKKLDLFTTKRTCKGS